MGKKYLIFIFIALAVLIFNPYPFLGGDNAVYSILAKSIATGQGYHSIYKPDSPPHIHYPPGFAFILSPLVLIFGLNLTILKLIPFLAAIASIFIYSRINWGSKETNLYSLLLFSVSPIILLYSTRVLSEIPFIAVLLGSIYFHKKQNDIPAWILAVVALYIRSAGLFLIGGYLIYYIFTRDFKRLLMSLGIFIILFLPWFIRNRLVSTEPTYVGQFFMIDPYNPGLGTITPILFLKRIFSNFMLYLFEILPMSFTSILGPINFILGILIIGITIVGLIFAGKKLRFTKYLIILFFISLLTWPVVWSSDRFLLSGLPLLFPFLIIGAGKVLKSYGRYLILGVMILSLVTIITAIPERVNLKTHYLKGDQEYGFTSDWRRYRQACFWARDHLGPGVIVSRKPEFTYLWSRHKSTIFPYSYDAEIVWQGIKDYDYILVDSFFWSATSRKYLIPAILQHRTEIEGLYRTASPEAWLLKIKDQTSQ